MTDLSSLLDLLVSQSGRAYAIILDEPISDRSEPTIAPRYSLGGDRPKSNCPPCASRLPLRSAVRYP